jgi:hypothetical protein
MLSLILLVCFASLTEGMAIQEVVQANNSAISRIWAIDTQVSTQFEIPKGTTEKDRALVEAQNYRYRYSFLNDIEHLHMERDVKQVKGELTGNTYRTGKTEILNGPDTLIQLTNFYGQLNKNGEVPADSPSSGVLGDRQVGPLFAPARMHLGLEVFNPTTYKPEPLSRILAKSMQAGITTKDAPSGKRAFEITARCKDFDLIVTIDENVGFAITSAKVTSEAFSHSMEYLNFTAVKDDIFMPLRFVNTVVNKGSNNAMRTNGDVAVDRVNNVDIQSNFKLDFPPMLPFTDLRTGQSGIWGNGSPAFYFQNVQEAQAWDERRKLATQTATRSGRSRPWQMVLVVMVLVWGVWLARTMLTRVKPV